MLKSSLILLKNSSVCCMMLNKLDLKIDQINARCKYTGKYVFYHQETGRMQLVSEDIHDWISHVGGIPLSIC